MIRRTFTTKGSIVYRLRLAFALIVMALMLFGLLSQNKFREISTLKNNLSQQAIPLVVRAQELVTLLSTQTEQITTLRDINVTADFTELSATATQRRELFINSVAAYQHLSGEEGLREPAAMLAASTDQLIELQIQRQILSRQRDDQLNQLKTLADEIEIRIEGLRLDILTRLQADTDALTTRPQAADQIAPLSLQLNTLVSLGLLIERIQDLGERTNRSHADDTFEPVTEDIRFVLRQMLGQLNRLDPTPDRANLASDIAKFRLLLLGTDGVMDTARAYGRIKAEISAGVDVSIGNIKFMETIIAQTLAVANAQAQSTSNLLSAAIRSLTIVNLTTIATLFSGLVLVVVFLVEMQLNQRIQSLHGSVRQLALGIYDDPIDVSGSDELGEVANQLRLSQKLSHALQRSNADLQSFASAASHDLKTPLRAITDLAEWTLEDASEELSEENRQNLVLLSNRSERLSNLLDGLLLYAQVEGKTDQYEVFDLVAECAGISDLLDPDGRYHITVTTDGAAFSTAAIPLRQILTNLLSNAMKHHDANIGQVLVRAALHDDTVTIEIEDDGPGIPQEYHGKIFELFQKLESADVVEGAGIGLALVKKLSERHGGGVTLLSGKEGQRGSTFRVVLAADPVL